MTLATIEAAAIDCERWSPLINALQSQGSPGGTSRPSASAIFAVTGSAVERAPHRLQARLEDVAAVDAFGAYRRHGNAERRLQDRREKRFALQRGQPLRIVESSRDALWVEHDGRRHHRAGERAAAGFVEPGNRPEPVLDRLLLERKIRLLVQIEEGRRIGTRASHVAAMLASVPILRKAFPAVGAAIREAPVGSQGRGWTDFFTACIRRQAVLLRSEQHELLVLLFGLDEEVGPERRPLLR